MRGEVSQGGEHRCRLTHLGNRGKPFLPDLIVLLGSLRPRRGLLPFLTLTAPLRLLLGLCFLGLLLLPSLPLRLGSREGYALGEISPRPRQFIHAGGVRRLRVRLHPIPQTPRTQLRQQYGRLLSHLHLRFLHRLPLQVRAGHIDDLGDAVLQLLHEARRLTGQHAGVIHIVHLIEQYVEHDLLVHLSLDVLVPLVRTAVQVLKGL